MTKFSLWLAVVLLIALAGAGAPEAGGKQCRTLRACRAQIRALKAQVEIDQLEIARAYASVPESVAYMPVATINNSVMPAICDRYREMGQKCSVYALSSGGYLVSEYDLTFKFR
jgi:hypothetical protein